ncbi:MAG: GH116 family glycosyl hydrolase, partial [Defluviitaleaceae bacterium]|nr:GH116 family glycosyl hydrolase [Defluviitaleaceae bacterium]
YGHYPAADAEYTFDAPINAGVRAWSSFIPGDSAKTNIPAAVFEIHLRNESDKILSGHFAMNFAGPNHQEARGAFFTKTKITESATGMFVCSEGGVNYFLGVYDENHDNVKTGTGFAINEKPEYGYGRGHFAKPCHWRQLLTGGSPQDEIFIERNGTRLYKDPSAAVSVPFRLESGGEKIITFVLTWYAPVFESATHAPRDKTSNNCEIEWTPEAAYGAQHHLKQMYASRYDSSLDVMRRMGNDRENLQRRIFAWQEALLTYKNLPHWLRDSLLNIFCLLTEEGYWFQPKYPLGDWSFPHGAFVYFESSRDCPHTCCNGNDWIGTMALTYFFPDLFRQMMRAYKAAQRKDGEVTFALGKIGDLPNLVFNEYTWQMSLNGSTYIMMVCRLWMVTNDDGVLQEFYESIKKSHDFTSRLAKKGWLCIADAGGSEWFEHSKFYGYCTHIAGLHLSELLIVERMALKMGDVDYAANCRREFEEAKIILHEKLWCGTHYLTWYDEDTNRKNDDVMAYQLDGLFTNMHLGIGDDIFDSAHAKTAIETIWNSNVKLANGYGALNYARADGEYIHDDADNYGKYSIFAQNTIIFAMTCMYGGFKERGYELAENTWRNLIIKQGLGWDMTHIVHALDGHKMFGSDYNQMGVIWFLPAAMEGTDITGPMREGHLVQSILEAAKK